jgi:hypothetical protein
MEFFEILCYWLHDWLNNPDKQFQDSFTAAFIGDCDHFVMAA